ncbi:hypothetical protein ARMSODRAFT_981500 [Armillaria solidipes]|uniref:Uncharacterized protein n=1 Tax=Armillaria solidipes TaxID=1076256 RepID=A0A2H3AS05_9AGAR|nr:hypothetical protein ARMSODRAFT_981500 [Armillaria solidipes]
MSIGRHNLWNRMPESFFSSLSPIATNLRHRGPGVEEISDIDGHTAWVAQKGRAARQRHRWWLEEETRLCLRHFVVLGSVGRADPDNHYTHRIGLNIGLNLSHQARVQINPDSLRPQCPVLLERDPLEPSNDYIQRQSVLPPRCPFSCRRSDIEFKGEIRAQAGDDYEALRTRTMIFCYRYWPGTKYKEAASATSMATGTSVLQNTNALHNELSEQLAQMATQLKRNALHFSDSLSADKAIVEKAQQKIESNFNFMRKERWESVMTALITSPLNATEFHERCVSLMQETNATVYLNTTRNSENV